ncbi:YphA family membrane protein [Paenibacillus harenae]|uniref:YphA family membrane protein n=1 Tax=Paenibacillus harenae TaxID=306543 RepID=UPI0040397174
MLLMPLWIHFRMRAGEILIHSHAAILLLLIAGIVTAKDDEGWNNKLYLALCGGIVGLIWGLIRKLYSYDPVFYWLGPSWDAPLLGGVLCGLFTSNGKQQFGIIVWGAVLGEFVYAILYKGAVVTSIGTVAWWDGFLASLAAARIASLAHRAVRTTGSKISVFLLNDKGGRSS